MEQLNSHFNNLAAAATSANAAMNQLIAANATLATTTADNIAEVKSLLLDVKAGIKAQALSVTPSLEAAATMACAKEVALLRLAIKNVGYPENFAQPTVTALGHTSATCKCKGLGHVNTATRSNPARPGGNINKHWDHFLESGS